MYDLGEFMKTLKQRLTQSYNGQHGRKGTLWEERYKSILVEGSANALSICLPNLYGSLIACPWSPAWSPGPF